LSSIKKWAIDNPIQAIAVALVLMLIEYMYDKYKVKKEKKV